MKPSHSPYPDTCHCHSCCCPSCKCPIIIEPTCMAYYAQYVFNELVSSLSNITLLLNFESGEKTQLINPTTIQLEAGYVYQISYTVQGTPGDNSYFQIVPLFNNLPQLLYVATGVSNSASNGNAHASATFITNAALNDPVNLSFRLATSVTSPISLLGAISIEVIG